MNSSIARIRGGLTVSCQAYPGEPMRTPETMSAVAQSAAIGGAVAIRAQGIDDLIAIRPAVDLPLIGLWKVGHEGVVITPTLDHALGVARTGADIVAMDATSRPRPDGRDLAETIQAVHEATDALVLADVSTHAEGVNAQAAGADLVATTLSGYTSYSTQSTEPDLDLISNLASDLDVPVIAEGRIQRSEHVAEALRRGAHSVVVGSAITHPITLTRHFVEATTEVTGRALGTGFAATDA